MTEDIENTNANAEASNPSGALEESPPHVPDAPLSPVVAGSNEAEEASTPLPEQIEELLASANEEDAASENPMEVDDHTAAVNSFSATETRSEEEVATSDDDADGEEVDDDVEILSVSSGVELMERAEYFEEPDETDAASVIGVSTAG
jgi:hypothetical protein